MRLLTSIVLLFVVASPLAAQKTPLSSDDMIRAAYLASKRRIPFSQWGIWRYYKPLDA